MCEYSTFMFARDCGHYKLDWHINSIPFEDLELFFLLNNIWDYFPWTQLKLYRSNGANTYRVCSKLVPISFSVYEKGL